MAANESGSDHGAVANGHGAGPGATATAGGDRESGQGHSEGAAAVHDGEPMLFEVCTFPQKSIPPPPPNPG